MKSIKIELYYSRQRKYYISIDRSYYIQFKSKTKAEAYIRKYKRVLRDNISQLQIINSQIHTVYSINYLQFDDLTCAKVDALFFDFSKAYRRIFFNFSEGNQTPFVFHNITVCFNLLSSILAMVKEFGQTHKNYSLSNQIISLKKFLEALYDVYDLDRKNIFFVDATNKGVIKIDESNKLLDTNNFKAI